jgi:hypothetical protein
MKRTNAIAAWTVEQLKTPETRMSMHLFAEVHGVPFTTLQTQSTPNDSKRIKLGSGVGRTPVLDDQREGIIFDVPIRKDWANEGASVGEAADSSRKCARVFPQAARSSPPARRAAAVQ